MDFNYEMEENHNNVLSETGNSFLALRKIRWKETSDFKYDVRRYYIKDGKEIYGKGCSLDNNACNSLALSLLKEGFGDTKEIINNIKDRDDFEQALVDSLDKSQLEKTDIDLSKVDPTEYYDPTTDIFEEVEKNE